MTDLNNLLNWFSDKEKVLVSLSGGVDSALVAYAANKELGNNAIAVTADYKTLSSDNFSIRFGSLGAYVEKEFPFE